jgi:apolipoprotein N-acyltransferase
MSDTVAVDAALSGADASPGHRPPSVPAGSVRTRLRSLARHGLARLLLALLCGFLLTLAFPGVNWWPLAPVAVAGLCLAVKGQTARFGALLGLVFGLAFFVPHLEWSGIYVGKLPWFALAAANAAYLAALGALLPALWRVPGRGFGMTLAGAGLWVADEAGRGRWPFGGFPWGRLAFSQSGAPTAGLAALGGAPLVTAAVAAAGTLLAYSVVALTARLPVFTSSNHPDPNSSPSDSSPAHPAKPEFASSSLATAAPAHRSFAAAALALVAAVLVTVCGLAVPRPINGPSIQVAGVQGNVPEAGLDFNARRYAVLDDHAHATLGLAARIKSGQTPQPAVVLWPENSSDIDPLHDAEAAATITAAVDAVHAPTLIGAVVNGPGDYLSNTGVVWRPGTGAGSGPDSTYVKRHPAPFAEYIPDRAFFRHFSSKVDLVPHDFISGNKLRANPVGVLSMGPAKVGDVICFEVAYDGLVRDPVKQGATLLAVQTNNATFGYSAESVQQLAMSRLRAIETGRTVVNISTVGVSGIILPNGKVVERSGHFTQQVLQAEVPLRTSLTVATRVGAWPEWILAAVGIGFLLVGAVITRKHLRKGTSAV